MTREDMGNDSNQPIKHVIVLCEGYICWCAVNVSSTAIRWDEDEKTEELKGPDARFILIWNKQSDTSEERPAEREQTKIEQDLVGFVNFRFTLQGEVVNKMEGKPTLMLYEINFKEEVWLVLCCQNLLLVICLLTMLDSTKRSWKICYDAS